MAAHLESGLAADRLRARHYRDFVISTELRKMNTKYIDH